MSNPSAFNKYFWNNFTTELFNLQEIIRMINK